MKTVFQLLNFIAIIACMMVLQSFQPSDPDESKIWSINNKLNIANKTFPSENVYLQLDRPSYWANDDVWFKVYLESEVDSSNIYVELISPTGKILQKKIYKSLDGLAYGDIHLPDTTSSGVYQIRSYTNWMRNFDEQSFFHKNLIIWNIKDENIIKNDEELNAKNIDIQFFPEGGNLLAGVKSKIGFKTVDENGLGVDVTGIILDEQGAFVTLFKSQYKGMGSFEFIPGINKRYTASITINGKTITSDLPKASHFGVALSLDAISSDQIKITITRNSADDEVTDNHYYIVGQTRGNVLFINEIDLQKGRRGLKIDKNELPTGVLQVTLMDANLIPQCERLTFVNHDDYVHVDIKTNKKTYLNREEVLVDITSFFKDSLPIASNLSMSAITTGNQLLLEEYPNNILTQFLLNSDLKGRVEEPAFYFKDNTKETLSALDNLMLTQGWRRFTWQMVNDNNYQPLSFDHQSSITVKGKVTTKFLEKPLPNCLVTLISEQQAYKFGQNTTDSLGQFLFDDLYFFNETSFLFKSEKENGGKNIWLELDESPLKSPVVEHLPVRYIMKGEEKVNTTYHISLNDSSIIQRKWHISDTILLGEINILGKNKKKELDQMLTVLPNPDKSITINEESDIAANIFDYMQFNLPGVYINSDTELGSGPSIRIGSNSGSALLLLNGIEVGSDVIASLSFGSFEKVDVQRFAPMFGIKGNNGAINFTTKRGVRNDEVTLPPCNKRINLKGYAIVREFYSPNYKDAKHTIEKTDFRNTLHWNPSIWTKENGKANVSFYNSDQSGEVNIIVEGFTTDGRLCRGICSFEVIY
jgi:hypothetical protein